MDALIDGGLKSPHVSVLYQQIITALRPKSSGCYVDGTVGAGGHAWVSLPRVRQKAGCWAGCGPKSPHLAKNRLSEYGERVRLVHSSYTALSSELLAAGWDHVDGMSLTWVFLQCRSILPSAVFLSSRMGRWICVSTPPAPSAPQI